MPDRPNLTPIQAAWLGFTDSTRILLVSQSDDRPLDQFLPFRDSVLSLIQSDAFLADLEKAWHIGSDTPQPQYRDVLLLELDGFKRAVEVANTVATSETEKKKWFGRLLGRASTVAGSVDDLIEKLPFSARAAIKLFRELVDLFKGKD